MLVLVLGGVSWEEVLLSRYCSLVAFGTVADVMQMSGENRTSGSRGRAAIGRSDFIGLHALLREAGLSGKEISSVQIGFVLAPRITAAGRMGAAAKAAELLTGQDVPLGDRKNMCYMGSTVVYGRGRAVITATGMDTEMGKIAGVLARTEQEETPLQKKLTQLGKTLSWLVLGICVFIFVFDLIVAGDFSLSGFQKTFMVAVSLAVAAVPEGLATVVTVVLSIGVTRMSRRNAVIRRLTAVETLGCTQGICSDNTGSLTQN